MYSIILPALGAAAGAFVAGERHRRLRAERLAAATLETLLNAIDANDELTGAHVRRVAAFAITLADAFGVDQHACREVERVALFHDVGKLHEALFDVVHDDEKPTPEERRAIATHPQKGADVLAPMAVFYPELPAGVLAHHERWDGTGYPHSLRGEAIPLASRIVAVADTFDAITASRRYHKGENVTRAFEIIREGRGTQFDPAVVDVFLSEAVKTRVRSILRDSRVAARRKRARPNRRGSTERGAPDVSFRWRDRVTTSGSAAGS